MASWVPIAPWRPLGGTGQNLTIGAANVASSPIADATQAVQLSAIGGNCHVAIGQAATATDMLVKASDPPLVVRVGKGDTINVIQDQSSTGTLNVIEVTH